MEQTQRKLLKQNQFSSGENEKKVPEVTVKYSEMSVVDKHLVDDFLDGNHCLEGGGGWWKYEFCFGKYVKQFHQDKQGRQDIMLGFWDERSHLAWLANNPQQLPSQTMRHNYISNFYVNGDVCDLTGKKRLVEVRLKCMQHYSKPKTVSITIQEKQPCEYILLVSSPIICKVLSQANQDGIIRLED